MGGVVARTMLTMQNYQPSTVNTIITLSAPHARPPVSFDSLMVNTYKDINEYWRKAHSSQWGTDNPLWHVTLVSIAGGGLDTIVPSDYSSIASLVPDTHGFTVFTAGIPTVWTGMDHLAITWCDEFRKVVVRALYDVMDVSRPAQTKVRGERMRSFKKHFLTGLEDIAERTLPHRGTSLDTIMKTPSAHCCPRTQDPLDPRRQHEFDAWPRRTPSAPWIWPVGKKTSIPATNASSRPSSRSEVYSSY